MTCLLGLGLGACGASSDPLGASEQPFSANAENGNADEANTESADASAACDEGVAPSEAPDGFCQVTARGLCFDDSATACACAGCDNDSCLIAESFPAQAFCTPDDDGTDPGGPPATDAPVSSPPNVGGGTNGSIGNTSPSLPGNAAPGCDTEASAPAEPSAPAHSTPTACAAGVPRDPSGTAACDFIVGGSCFDDGEAACACAGCSEGCMVQESYPAQVSCH